MIGRLFRKMTHAGAAPGPVTAAVPAWPSLPPGRRVYAIGDVHGRLDLLDDLLSRIAADDAPRAPAATTIILLGDLVDRGPDSAGVIDRAMALVAAGKAGGGPETVVLKGNHEEMFLAAAAGRADAIRPFCKFGGRETVLSYPISEDAYNALGFDALARELLTLVPRAHVDFLADAADSHRIGDYLFVHAAIDPDVPLDQQRARTLRWGNKAFLASDARHDAFVVHGHTIRPAPDVRPGRLGIDTGAYASGILTAVGLEGTDRWFLAARDAAADPVDWALGQQAAQPS